MPQLPARTETDECKKLFEAFATTLIALLSASFSQDADASPEKKRQWQERELGISRKGLELERRCLSLLCDNSHTQGDLKTIGSIMKTKTELEHLGELAALIPERAGFIGPELFASFRFDVAGNRLVHFATTSIEAFTSDGEPSMQISDIEHDISELLQQATETARHLLQATTIPEERLLAAISLSRIIGHITAHAAAAARHLPIHPKHLQLQNRKRNPLLAVTAQAPFCNN